MKTNKEGKQIKIIHIIKYIIYSSDIYGVVGRIFGALSLFQLAHHAFLFGLSDTVKVILDVYIVSIKATIGYLDPVVLFIYIKIKNIFLIKINFSENWRVIFAILQLLFIRDAQTAFGDGRKRLGVVRLISGTIVSFIVSVFIYSSYCKSSIISNMILCVMPVFGIFIYDIIMYLFSATVFFNDIGVGESDGNKTKSEFFVIGVKKSIFRFFLVTIASISIFLLPIVQNLNFPQGGFMGILFGTFVNSLYWISTGSIYAKDQITKNISFAESFIMSEAGRFGLSVLGVIFWFTVFNVLNAGMRIIGF